MDVNRYRYHLNEGRCGGQLALAIQIYRQIIEANGDLHFAPSFECDNCLERDEFRRLHAASLLEHTHDDSIAFELHVFCKACLCAIPLCGAVGHAALAHADWIGTSLADAFVTAPSEKHTKIQSLQATTEVTDTKPINSAPVPTPAAEDSSGNVKGDAVPTRTGHDKAVPATEDKAATGFNCPLCEESFPDSAEVTQHVAIEHPPSDESNEVRRSDRLGQLAQMWQTRVTRSSQPSIVSSDSGAVKANGETANDRRTATSSLGEKATKTIVRPAPRQEGSDFVCTVCGKAFAGSGALATHYRSHGTRAVPGEVAVSKLTCRMCNRTYGRTSALNKHLRKFHRKR